MIRVGVADFEQWREAARSLLRQDVPPDEIVWAGPSKGQPDLFNPPAVEKKTPQVPARFLALARTVSRHQDPAKWSLLYRALYRLTHGEKNLLALDRDADTAALLRMEREAVGETQATSAAPFVPTQGGLPAMRKAVQDCKGCDLYRSATQSVFGEGPAGARLVFVGEQPGDQEDRQGRPFVGPAGKLLDQALEEGGIARSDVYITNAVKHFKFVLIRGKRRLHQTPRASEVTACRPWLEAEMHAIRPSMIVCLGATAAQSVMQRTVRVLRERGQFFPHPWAQWATVTIHPSALLRVEDEKQRQIEYERFVADLRRVREKLDSKDKDE